MHSHWSMRVVGQSNTNDQGGIGHVQGEHKQVRRWVSTALTGSRSGSVHGFAEKGTWCILWRKLSIVYDGKRCQDGSGVTTMLSTKPWSIEASLCISAAVPLCQESSPDLFRPLPCTERGRSELLLRWSGWKASSMSFLSSLVVRRFLAHYPNRNSI